MESKDYLLFLGGLAQAILIVYKVLQLKKQLSQHEIQKKAFQQVQKINQSRMIALKKRTLEQNRINPNSAQLSKIYQDIVLFSFMPIINSLTFSHKVLDLPIKDNILDGQQFLQNMCGGYFQAYASNIFLNCHINNAIIASSVLQKKQINVKIFKDQNKPPRRKNVFLTLSTTTAMALYGRLTYNIQARSFQVDTKFLGSSILQILKYWDDKIDDKKGKIAVGILVTIFITYAFLLNPLLYFSFTIKNKIEQIFGKDFNDFNQLNFKTNPNWKLVCPKCKNNTQDVIFGCGHLAVCLKCQKSGTKQCPVCGKKSTRFLQIFFS